VTLLSPSYTVLVDRVLADWQMAPAALWSNSQDTYGSRPISHIGKQSPLYAYPARFI